MTVRITFEFDSVEELAKAIAFLRCPCGKPPPQPGKLIVGEPSEVTMIRYPFTMPPLPDIPDLATREVSYVVNDGAALVESHAKDETTFTHDFAAGDHVIVTLRDVDTSGNKSLPSLPLEFTAAAPDTTPPPQPGVITAGVPEDLGDNEAAATKKKAPHHK